MQQRLAVMDKRGEKQCAVCTDLQPSCFRPQRDLQMLFCHKCDGRRKAKITSGVTYEEYHASFADQRLAVWGADGPPKHLSYAKAGEASEVVTRGRHSGLSKEHPGKRLRVEKQPRVDKRTKATRPMEERLCREVMPKRNRSYADERDLATGKRAKIGERKREIQMMLSKQSPC